MQSVQAIFLVALSLFGTLSLCNGQCTNTALTLDCSADFSAVVACSSGVVGAITTQCLSPQVCTTAGGTAICGGVATAATAAPTAPTAAPTTAAPTTAAPTTAAPTTAAPTTAAPATAAPTTAAPTTAAPTTAAPTTVAGTTLAPIPVSIQCSGTGFFPDPFNCRYFHDCRSGPMSILYVCNAGYAYYAPGNKCLLQTSDSDCVTINCAGSTAYKPYYPYSNYYTKCGSATTTIFRCATTNQYFSTATNTCVS